MNSNSVPSVIILSSIFFFQVQSYIISETLDGDKLNVILPYISDRQIAAFSVEKIKNNDCKCECQISDNDPSEIKDFVEFSGKKIKPYFISETLDRDKLSIMVPYKNDICFAAISIKKIINNGCECDCRISDNSRSKNKGYIEFPGVGSYKFHGDYKTWDEAKKACESENAHLAIINSEIEKDVLMHISGARQNVFINAWIGIYELPQEDEWIDVLDKPVNSSSIYYPVRSINWLSNRLKILECGLLLSTEEVIKSMCSQKYKYLCEFNKSST